ncbi:hypothetical protein [Mycobacterium persicum]|uniref:Uncharacterized protein n=1 Tax=Mycobacterium persicum TaxID=1487726 RepID=A0AB38V1D9_9MYCO|nr:hypothetical protein [Mycobacterium persicum]ORB98817.1 hypothetical protein B1T48_28140 [Mycobacterium persicum]VAZ86702.1 hypothetical protein LAUMK42_05555 [Mycobacterium persicum]
MPAYRRRRIALITSLIRHPAEDQQIDIESRQSHFHRSLRRDGYQVDEQTGQITAVGPQLSIESIARLADPSAIREGFERIRRAISDDPALAVGSAKELIEITAKVVLTERGRPFDDKSDLPKLARAAQISLGLDPSTGSGPDSSDGVRRILSAVTTIANGLAEAAKPRAGYPGTVR